MDGCWAGLICGPRARRRATSLKVRHRILRAATVKGAGLAAVAARSLTVAVRIWIHTKDFLERPADSTKRGRHETVILSSD